MALRLARVYDPPDGPGFRVLLDPVWPRGIARAARDTEHNQTVVLRDLLAT